LKCTIWIFFWNKRSLISKRFRMKIWKQRDPSEAFIRTKLHENCRLGLIESVHEVWSVMKNNILFENILLSAILMQLILDDVIHTCLQHSYITFIYNSFWISLVLSLILKSIKILFSLQIFHYIRQIHVTFIVHLKHHTNKCFMTDSKHVIPKTFSI
jgi:hypothetical protein